MTKFYAKKKPGMKRAKSGKYYYPRKGKARMGKKAMKVTAKQAALALKITKKKRNTVIMRPFGVQPGITQNDSGQNALTGLVTTASHWQVFNPLYLPATLQQHDPENREDMRIYANNCQAEIEVYMNKNNIDCCYVRCIYGFYYGLPNQADSNALTGAQMDTLLPQHSSRLDPANATTRQFKIISDRQTLKVPKQLYDSNWSDDNQTALEAIFGDSNPLLEGEEITHALWTPYKKTFNFKFNRQFTYQNSDADSIVGANPFIAIGVFPCGDAHVFKSLPLGQQTYDGKFQYADDDGALHSVAVTDLLNPSPALSVKLTTYFKDVM